MTRPTSQTRVDANATVVSRSPRPSGCLLPEHIDAAAQIQEVDQRRSRNSFQIILRIPIEILAKISLQYVEYMRPSPTDHDFFFQPSPNVWIRIAHICHQWREVALHTPTLWASFKATKPALSLELLTRSKAAPLNIKMDYMGIYREDILDHILAASSRLHDIDIHFGIPDNDLRRRVENWQAPQLQKIALRAFNMPQSLMKHQIPSIFESCELPSLTRLHLEGFAVDWTNNLLAPTLTHLNIQTGFLAADSPQEIFDALEKMTRLRYLTLGSLLSDTITSFPRHNRRITLPALERIHLTSSAKTCSFLLSHIEYPRAAHVKLVAKFHYDSDQLVELTTAVFSKLAETDTPCLSLSLSMDAMEQAGRLRSWAEDISPDIPLKEQDIQPLIDILIMDTDDIAVHQIIKCISTFTPLSHTKALFISTGEESTDAVDWICAFSQLPNVENLILNTEELPILVESLIVSTPWSNETQTSAGGPPWGLQNLKRLYIIDSTFDPDSIDELLMVLKRRQKAQKGLQLLKVTKCYDIGERDIQMFRDRVDRVHWDGVVSFAEKDEEEEDEEDNGWFIDSNGDDEDDMGWDDESDFDHED